MGGLALKSVDTIRCNREEFDIISTELIIVLKQSFKNVGIPMFYKNKKTFGDIDIIISTEGFSRNIQDYIVETFKPTEIFHNGNCWSFDYKKIQIDLIITSAEHYDSYLFYMGGNDLGNFIGRIAQGFGLKYGQEGLWYEHYFRGMNIGRIPVSKDYRAIFAFLGLSYERWEQGFDELEDIFEYIATSPYFNWEMFQLSKLNKINRERNLKRKSYMSFLKWMEENVADDNHKFEFKDTYMDNKDAYIDVIDEHFPEAGVMTEIRRLEYEHTKALYIKSKFNGGDVMRKYGLKDKALGDAMSGFKKYIEESIFGPYERYILTQQTEFIYKRFEKYLGLIETNK